MQALGSWQGSAPCLILAPALLSRSKMADAAVDAGLAAGSVAYVETSQEAASLVSAAVRPGDLVLVKGSRGIRTDLVADRIASELG